MEAATYEMMRELEDDHWWFVARRQILEQFVSSFRLAPEAPVLEIGCGTGGNMDMLSRHGLLTCVEMDSEAAAMARNRDVAPVHKGYLPDGLPAFETSFQLVTLFDVIEHIEEDSESLVVVKSLLAPGGHLLVTVPAFPFLWSIHDDENHHKRRYRKTDIEALARSTGLVLEYVSYFNFWLFPPVALVRLIRNILPYEESWQDMKKPPGWLNSILQTMFASERRLLERFSLPFGVSLVAVFRKPDFD